MAKIKYSALVSDMRNKLNGSVLSRNRYGSYIRNKVTPVNPQTQYQQQARAIFSAASSAWAELTQSARQGFAALAESHKYTDIFGDEKALDGKAMFVKLNSNLQHAGLPMISKAPSFQELGSITNINLFVEAVDDIMNDMALSVTTAGTPANAKIFIFATPPLPPEINFVKNRLRLVGSYPANDIGAGFISDYPQRFGNAMKVGDRIHIRVTIVSATSGQQSIPVQSVATVV